jgi:hypothetical protein
MPVNGPDLETPWSRPASVPSERFTAVSYTLADHNFEYPRLYERLMHSEPSLRDISTFFSLSPWGKFKCRG